jgi:hypothetical protein
MSHQNERICLSVAARAPVLAVHLKMRLHGSEPELLRFTLFARINGETIYQATTIRCHHG